MADKKNVAVYVAMLLIVSIVVVGIMAWVVFNPSEPDNVDYVEVREYEGQDLSSISAFRENSIDGPQYVDNQTYRLALTGLVDNPKNYTYDEVVNGFSTHKKVVTLYCVEGWKVTILWDGIQLADLFENAQVDSSANTVIFYAYDGYSTALPLDYILENDIMIAYKMNNVTLPAERGYPFQLVAESKLGYKWIKWITQIELSNDEDYLGFWESYGYPNEANLR
ncbi:MAG: molybdopterin-dependent oxidoreductase [Candidatus Bathyarchaeota archaeon]|nr:molybdopterin-dependent oxidoreductase [Candidatus Bathyarchaeum sp.]